MKKKQPVAIDRETALKLTAIGGIGSLLTLLCTSAEASSKSGAFTNPMNLMFTLKTVKTKSVAKGDYVIQIWAEGNTPKPIPGNAKPICQHESVAVSVDGPDEKGGHHNGMHTVLEKIHFRAYVLQ